MFEDTRRWRDGRAAVSGSAQAITVVLHDLSCGGTERIALRLADRWARMGRDVRLICGDDAGPLRTLVAPGVELRSLRPAIPRGPGARARLARAVGDLLARQPCDLLFVPGNYHWDMSRSVAALAPAARPCVVAQVSNPLRRLGRSPLGQALFERRLRRLMSNVGAAVVLSEASRRETDALMRRPLSVRVPLPALEDVEPPPTPPPPGPPTILAIGRLVEQKDFRLAIEAFARLRDPDARLVILGEGPQRARLAARIAELGQQGRIELAGYVADVRPWLAQSRLLLMSSRFEGFGAVAVEALAAGRQVVATPCGGAVDDLLWAPGSGVVAKGHDPDALATALEQALAAPPPEPAALARLVEAYRIGPVAEAYLEVFDQARSRMLADRSAVPARSRTSQAWALSPEALFSRSS